MLRHALGLTGLVSVLFLAATVRAAEVSVPNGSFEDGTTSAPTGWVLSGGVGTWEHEGRTGSRCLSVTGDGKSSNYWSCPVAFEPGKIYRVEFWTKSSPDAAAGNVIAAGSLCNFDFPHTREWTRRSMVFRVPDRSDRPLLRLGQWQTKGKVWFDDIQIRQVSSVDSVYDKYRFGAGERLANARYEFTAPLSQRMNWARPMEECSAGFNSNRWLLNDDSEICFRYVLPGVFFPPVISEQAILYDPKLAVDVGYYVSGQCVVEARWDDTTWTLVGVIEGVRTAEFSLPKDFTGASAVWIRILGKRKNGEGKPCSLQIHGFRFSASVGLHIERDMPQPNLDELAARRSSPRRWTIDQLEKPIISFTGATYVIEETPVWPGREAAKNNDFNASLEMVGAPSLGGRHSLNLLMISSVPRRLIQTIDIDGEKQHTRPFNIPKGESSGIATTTYNAGKAGEHHAQVSLLDEKTSKTLYEASWEYRVPSLYDSGFGHAITAETACDLWWAEGPYKINRRCPTPEARQAVAISAAKGEYEPFQLVVTPKRDLKNVAVKVSPLQAGRGETIPAEAVEVCRVGYVSVTSPTDEIGCAGEWPDPLPPCDKPFDLRASDGCQPLWITVHVPRDAKAGDYRGTIELAAEGWKTSVPFTLHVWDFEIPRENHLKTAFGFSTGNVKRYHNLTTDDELRKVTDLYYRNFAEHRIAPYDCAPFDSIEVGFPDTPDGDVKLDFSRFDPQAERYFGPDYRFSTFRLPLRGMGGGTFHSRQTGRIGRFEQGSPEYEKIFAAYLRRLESHLRDKGWLDKAYIYWFDEPDPKDYEFVRDGMERIHRAAPGLRRMLTEQPEKELDGAVDIWCPLTPTLTPELVARERAKGREVWWYICTGPKGPYCTLFIDHPGIEFRMWSWQTWKFGVQGLLIWQSNYWTSDAAFPSPQLQNPWQDPMSYMSGYSTPAGTKKHWGNGDGRFMYPPNRDPMNDKTKYVCGPVNSIRWEMLREGIEDYEYLWLLRDLVEKAKARDQKGEAVARAESLLKIPDSITSDQTHFTKDPVDLYRYREQVARAIEALRKGK